MTGTGTPRCRLLAPSRTSGGIRYRATIRGTLDTIRDPAIKAACDAFLDGYRSVRPLLAEEEAAIPASVKARDVWETGSWLEFDKNVDPAVVRKGLHSLAAQFRRFTLPDG